MPPMVSQSSTYQELLDEIARLRGTVARLTVREKTSESLPMMDGLTRLYNRTSFVSIADQRLKAITRRAVPTTLITFGIEDMDGLSNRLGSETGDDARRAAGELIRETFRASDLVGRVSDDTFAVLAVDASADVTEHLLGRLWETLDGWNDSSAKAMYRLNLDVGMATWDPTHHETVTDLLDAADQDEQPSDEPTA